MDIKNTVELSTFRIELDHINSFIENMNNYSFTYNPVIVAELEEQAGKIEAAIKNYEMKLMKL